jgi:hypothetical protein
MIPIRQQGGTDKYIVPYPLVGWQGGRLGDTRVLGHVTIVVRSGTRDIVTAYPSEGR